MKHPKHDRLGHQSCNLLIEGRVELGRSGKERLTQALRRWAGIGLALVFFLQAGIAPAPVFGQATEGSILGTITDGSGAAIVGATVNVTSVQTGYVRTTPTNEAGDFVVTNLPLGSYTVSTEMAGFKKAIHPPVEITVKARVRVNLQLEVGEVTQSVDVSAEAPLLKTDTVEVSTVVRRDQLQDLPVVSRHFLSLSVLTPGTVYIPTGRVAEFSGGTGIGAVGIGSQGANQNNFILDGISNNMEFSGAMGVQPSLDAIQEFSIQTSGYSAEFGKAGGGIVNVAIRSGSNELHGFAYDYLRNDILNARPYDFTGTNPARLPLRRNLFGGGAGLPVIKNKVFLFANYEGLRAPTSVITYARVPTPLERQGDFSQSGYTIYDPATNHPSTTVAGRIERDSFPNNRIPTGRIQPGMAKLIALYPEPNFKDPINPANLNNFRKALRNQDILDSINLKGDYKATSKDTLTLRYSSQWVHRDRDGFMPDGLISGTGTLNGTNSGLTYTRVFSPAVVNEFRMGWNYLRYGNTPINGDTFTSDLGIPGINVKPFFPNINPQNITRTSPVRALTTIPSPFNIVQNSFQYMDNLSWHKGNHALKFGGEVSWHRNDTWAPALGGVEAAYNANQTTPFVGATREAIRTGTPDFLLGLSNQFTTYYDYDKARIRVQRHALFAHDDWRVTRKLSLSMGLRYEVLPYWSERLDKLTNFDLSTGMILIPDTTRSLLTTLGLPNGSLPVGFKYVPIDQVVPATDYLNFAPRFGFAYSLNDRMVLRGGFGIYFAGWDANVNSNTGGSPFNVRVRFSGSNAVPIDVRDGFPSGSFASVVATPFPEISQMIESGRPDPYSEKYNFNLQLNPFQKTAIEVGYNGSRSIAFQLNGRFNHPRPGPGNIQSRRPYPLFGDGFGAFYEGDYWYNALEVTLRQREVHGVSIDSNFTWSKNIGVNGRTNTYDPMYDYGRTFLDYGKRWVTSFVYRIPTPSNLHKVVRHIIGDWQSSGIVILQGGFPFSVNSNQDMNDNINASRANVVTTNGPAELPAGDRTIRKWFNTAAFATPAIYIWGNSGINILNGPGFAQVDFGIQKSFQIMEGKRLGFRMEAMNLFNRVNLGNPGSSTGANTGNAALGQITSLYGEPRQIQISLRFDF